MTLSHSLCLPPWSTSLRCLTASGMCQVFAAVVEMPVSEDSVNRIVLCYKSAPRLLSRAQALLPLTFTPFHSLPYSLSRHFLPLTRTLQPSLLRPLSLDLLSSLPFLTALSQRSPLILPQAKMAAERFAKCYSFPKGLDFPQLIDDLEYWAQSAGDSKPSAKKGGGGGGGKGRGKGKKGKGRK